MRELTAKEHKAIAAVLANFNFDKLTKALLDEGYTDTFSYLHKDDADLSKSALVNSAYGVLRAVLEHDDYEFCSSGGFSAQIIDDGGQILELSFQLESAFAEL